MTQKAGEQGWRSVRAFASHQCGPGSIPMASNFRQSAFQKIENPRRFQLLFVQFWNFLKVLGNLEIQDGRHLAGVT